MEAKPETVGQLLEMLFPGRDITAGLKRVQTVVEALAGQITAGMQRVLIPACEMADRLEAAPPVPGYEPMLIKRGHPPLMARGLSHWLRCASKDEVSKTTNARVVADTLRFLAKPGRAQSSISRKAGALLEVWNATAAALSDVFQGSSISVFEFVEALEGAVRGEFAACRRVREVAAALGPGLSVRRGPKVTEASITHQLLLGCVANTAGPKSYTFNPVSGDFTDPLTRATRLAFGNSRFDPRPAFRQHRARRQQKSN
jgi:hypothetical protein